MKPFAIIGPTCSGKTTLADQLEHECGIPRIRTYTTRPQRSDEDPDAYYFIEDQVFSLMDEKKMFDETKSYTVADGSIWRYGSIIAEVKEPTSIILTPDGARKTFDKLEFVICLYANSFTRYARGLARGDDPIELSRRIGMESYVFSKEKLKDLQCPIIYTDIDTYSYKKVIHIVHTFY